MDKWTIIRISLAALLLLLSFLTIAKAPTNFFWRVAVAITEFPWLPMILVLVLGVWTYWTAAHHKFLQLSLYGAALIFYSLPVVLTYIRTATLDQELAAVFGSKTETGQLERPFSFWKMFPGIAKDVPHETFVYKDLPDRDLKIDYYKAQTNAKAPCVIVIHGGSWQSGDRTQLPALNGYLAAQGYHVVAMDYRLAPAHLFPAPIEDFNDALSWVNAHAEQWNIDTSNIVVIGRSAGGQIALMAAYSQHLPQIRGVVSFYAPADMAWGARIKTNKLVLDADKVLSEYIGGSVENVPELYDAASAPQFAGKNTPPTLLIHGPNDAMVSYRHSTRLKRKLDEQGIPGYLLDLPTSTHGCDYNLSGPSGQASTYAIERFIRAVIVR